jgi:acetyl esterase/lipase
MDSLVEQHHRLQPAIHYWNLTISVGHVHPRAVPSWVRVCAMSTPVQRSVSIPASTNRSQIDPMWPRRCSVESSTLTTARRAGCGRRPRQLRQDRWGSRPPLASPALGDWAGQPRLIVQASNAEVLRDDALLLSQTATEAGVDVRLKIHDGVSHIWNLAYPSTPASKLAVGYMAEQLEDLSRATAAQRVEPAATGVRRF